MRRLAVHPTTGDAIVAAVGCPLMSHEAHDDMPCEYCGMTFGAISEAAETTEERDMPGIDEEA